MRRRTLTFAALVLGASLANACAHHRIVAPDQAPATSGERRRVHSIVWGARETRIEPRACVGSGLATVTVRVTWLDALATVVTAGFWSTATVEWTCAKDGPGRQP